MSESFNIWSILENVIFLGHKGHLVAAPFGGQQFVRSGRLKLVAKDTIVQHYPFYHVANWTSAQWEINIRENRKGNKEWINPETLATLVTQDTGRRQTKHNTTHKTKKKEQHWPHQTTGVYSIWSYMIHVLCFVNRKSKS